MTLAEKQHEITSQLGRLKSGQDRLAFLVEKAKARRNPGLELRVEKNRVPGCLAKLWLAANSREGRCYFECDSDSLIVKAVAGLLCDFYSDQSPREILRHDPAFLATCGITQHLTPNRRNALGHVWATIRQFAERQLVPDQTGEELNCPPAATPRP